MPLVGSFIDDILNDREPGAPIVVWAHHHEIIDGIANHVKSINSDLTVNTLDGRIKPDERSKIVRDFQNGKIDVLVAGVTAAGVGITLTRATVAIVAELDWTPATMVQAEDRLHRIGQDEPVTIYYCVSPNSIDGRIAGMLKNKQDVIDTFTEDLISEVN